MKWDEFVVAWSSTLNTGIPEDALREWQRFVKSTDSEVMKSAIQTIADRYYAGDNKKSPTLYNMQSAYHEIMSDRQRSTVHAGCDFCEYDASANVCAIDSGNYDGEVFPPDPETWQGLRRICVLPCPCCRANEYADQRMRDRVRRYAKPLSKRNSLFVKRVPMEIKYV